MTLPASPSAVPSIPKPRPEARGMSWSQLAEPTRRAVCQLLLRLAAAVEAARRGSQSSSDNLRDPGRDSRSADLASSLLVTGKRGAGKTTLLLTARYAVENPGSFFDDDDDAMKSLRHLVDDIGPRIAWLDVLDLEPLPRKANLLATLLVRVRDVLERDRGHRGKADGAASTSLYEQRANDPWELIDRLIRDATFMWDEISAPDARDRTHLQIKAAEIYAGFRRRFTHALGQVSHALAARDFGHTTRERVVLILPIDNVDRSSEHLHAIMKLSQMVACRELWLLLAASRSDFQVLLERAFQNELAGDDKSFRPNIHGEDEALAIVRRQAAASLRRSLPPAHQITIEPLTAEEALEFSISSEPGASPTLRDLLAAVPLPISNDDSAPQTLLDLIDISARLRPRSSPEDAEPRPWISEPGRHALSMPARNLVDLWQTLCPEPILRGGPEDRERAPRVAESMLRGLINESELPSWADHLLNEKILQRDPHDPRHITLDFTGTDLSTIQIFGSGILLQMPVPRSFSPPEPTGFEIDDPVEPPLVSRVTIRLYRFQGFNLGLGEDVISEDVGAGEGWAPVHPAPVELPTDVEGWLMLLFDMLLFGRGPRILNQSLRWDVSSPTPVETVFSIWDESLCRSLAVPIPWSIPGWCSFHSREIFHEQWRHLFDGFKHRHRRVGRDKPPTEQLRLLRVAWIDNILSLHDTARGGWPWEELLETLWPESKERPAQKAIEGHENKVFKKAADLYDRALGKAAVEHHESLKVWLEDELPLFLVHGLIPGLPVAGPPKNRRLAKVYEHRAEDLAQRWRERFYGFLEKAWAAAASQQASGYPCRNAPRQAKVEDGGGAEGTPS